MRAAYIEQFGPPETMRVGEIPAPVPGPTDVLVDVISTTVNSVDALIRAGIYRVPVTFPFVIGHDMVGRVAATDLLAQRGRIIVFAGARSQPALPVIALFQKNASIHGFAISDATTAELARAAREVNRLLADGRLRARHIERRPLSDAAEAHRMTERGALSGRRVVLEVV